MKKLLTMVFGMAAVTAFAVVAPTSRTITFSTVGPDTYEDGTPVMAGECYALVWSADGVFDGIAADGTTIDAEDKVLFIGPYATDAITGKMHCPTIVFNIAAGYLESKSGHFEVYLLDTRKYGEDGKATVSGNSAVKVVNRATKAVSDLAVSSSGSMADGNVVAEGISVADKTDLPTGIDKDKVKVRITDMKINAENVVLKVEGTVPFINYAATTSSTIGGEGTVGKPIVGKADEPIYIVAPNTGNSGFFKVDRK